MFNPIYKKNQLIIGNSTSPCGIVTLWSAKSKIAKNLDTSSFSALGQLYSATRGLDPLVRNLLANPTITQLFVYGRDLSKSGEILADFFKEGVVFHITSHNTKCWRVKSSAGDGFIDPEISIDALDILRNSIKFSTCGSIEELREKLNNPDHVKERNKAFIFNKKKISLDFYPSEETAVTVRDKTVAQVWLKILDTITRFGSVTQTHYDSSQKEILNLISVISDEGKELSDFYIPSFLPCDTEELERYIPRVVTNKKYPDCSYTYGQRLREFFGTDQVQAIVERLVNELDARSAVASLWDPAKDSLKKSGTPCLNHIWVRVRNNRLFLTAIIRSNDMFSGWPENAFALRRLQEIIRTAVSEKASLDLGLGDLVIISQSAHIYEDCWEASMEILEKNFSKEVKEKTFDPRGHFSVEVDCGKIIVEHITTEGEFLRKFEGKSMKKLSLFLSRNQCVSSLEHALYLGAELQKAELALRTPELFKYVQDQPLMFLK